MFHDQSLRPLSRSLALLVLLLAAGCGGGDDDAEPAAPAAVSIASPQDAATAETVTIAGAETTTEPEEGEAIEDWEGRYEGEVVWDCGAAGRHRGTLEAELLILTYEGGRAVMEAFHTVTGSCADAGSRTTPLLIQGRRTANGFTFPSRGWGIPGRFNLQVNGDRAEGRVSGEVPGPATMTIVFDLECTFRC